MKVRRGFFWGPPSAHFSSETTGDEVRDCVFFMYRPAWYDIAGWWRAMRYWIDLSRP